jgi:soluble lytic murein transglycosylase-like protein
MTPGEPAALADVPSSGRTLPLQAGKRYADMIAKVAREQKLEPALLHAVIAVESAYNPQAKSPKGATGLMQLMPDTAKRYGVTDLLNPLENLRAGARYLRDLLGMFNNNLKLVLAAYNAGEGAVIRSGNAIPNYPETRSYVPRVLQHYELYRSQDRPS